jgi:hypothetical protein
LRVSVSYVGGGGGGGNSFLLAMCMEEWNRWTGD